MARIAGINLSKDKTIFVAITAIYGIGRQTSHKLLEELSIKESTRVKDLTEDEVQRLRTKIEKMRIEGDLRRGIVMDIKRLQEINTYRGFRHKKKLPLRGQRTRNNARTRRGKKTTMGSGRRKDSKK